MITLIDGDVEKRPKDFGMFVMKGHEHPIVPTFENKTQAIPGRSGVWSFGNETNEKIHTIPFGLMDYDGTELQRKMTDFVSFLFDEYGRPKILKLIYDYEPDKFYSVKIASDITPKRNGRQDAEFEVVFLSADPFKYSNVFSDEITWGSEEITFESTYMLGQDNPLSNLRITASKSVNISVTGQSVRPVFEIAGSATNLELYANGKKIIVGTFVNAVWRIECDKYIGYKDGVETMLDMDDFILKSGDNTVFVYGSNMNIIVSAKYREKWL